MPRNYHIFLKGEVGSRWSGNFTSDMVNWILDKHQDSEVNVLINSLGGYTHEGLAISSLFKIHGNVHVHFIGQSASAATIAAMGAKKISIDADAMFLVHRCSGVVLEWAYMNTEQIDEFIKKLEKQKDEQSKIDTVVANLYARRCKKSTDALMQLMSKDTWLTAQEAKEWGFVDEITDDPEDKEPLTESTAAAMSSAGMPIPPGYKGKKGSFVNRFFDFLRSLNNQDSDSDTSADQSAPDPIISQHMNKDTTPAEEQQHTAAHEQPANQSAPTESNDTEGAPVSEQSDKDAEIAALKQQIAERDRTISELRKQPADQSPAVVESKKDEPDPYAPVSEAEALAASKAFIENF